MTDQEWKLVGILVTVFIFTVGSVIVALRSLRKQCEAEDSKLHERINRVRDEYVRRTDHDSHMMRIENVLKEMRDEQRGFARDMMAAWNRGGPKQ